MIRNRWYHRARLLFINALCERAAPHRHESLRGTLAENRLIRRARCPDKFHQPRPLILPYHSWSPNAVLRSPRADHAQMRHFFFG